MNSFKLEASMKGVKRSFDANLVMCFNYNDVLYAVYRIPRDKEQDNIFISQIDRREDGDYLIDIDNVDLRDNLKNKVRKSLDAVYKSKNIDNIDNDLKLLNVLDFSNIRDSKFSVVNTYISTSGKDVISEISEVIKNSDVKNYEDNMLVVDASMEVNLLSAIGNSSSNDNNNNNVNNNHDVSIKNDYDKVTFDMDRVDKIRLKPDTCVRVNVFENEAATMSFNELSSLKNKINGNNMSSLENNNVKVRKLENNVNNNTNNSSKAGFVNTFVLSIVSVFLV